MVSFIDAHRAGLRGRVDLRAVGDRPIAKYYEHKARETEPARLPPGRPNQLAMGQSLFNKVGCTYAIPSFSTWPDAFSISEFTSPPTKMAIPDR